jgi:hypothetical protein
MKIGIDISQLAYPGTGVANYLQSLVFSLIESDSKNEYILFFSSLRGKLPIAVLALSKKENVTIKTFKFPPSALNIMWNKIHKHPIENFIGEVDWFITSDWTEPPAMKAKKGTIIYDMIVYKYPQETHEKIIKTQKKKLSWVKKESDVIFTISESSKKDIEEILGIDPSKIKVIYPGL